MSHTPGPWQWSKNKAGWREVVGPQEDNHYRGGVANVFSSEHIDGVTVEEADANANLIAAAPELKTALQRLMQVAVWDEDTDRDEFDAAIAAAQQAIAKAEAA